MRREQADRLCHRPGVRGRRAALWGVQDLVQWAAVGGDLLEQYSQVEAIVQLVQSCLASGVGKVLLGGLALVAGLVGLKRGKPHS